MDRLQAMTVFVAVADEEGFAAAARRLNMSPPSITRAVSEMEARLGARLLHRTTRSVQLTEAGQRYLADCRRILSEIEEADRHVAGIHAAPQGLVTVTASVPLGRMVLMPILFDLLDRYPDISISLLLIDRIMHLLDDGIDVAVRIGELPDSSLTAIRVGTVRRVLCVSPEYLAEHGRPRCPSDLSDHEIVDNASMVSGSDWTFHRDDETENYRPRPRFHVNKADAAVSAATVGRGITRVYSHMVAAELASGNLELVLEEFEPPPMPVHIMHKEAGQTSARVRAVVDHCVEGLRKHPALH